MLERLLALGAQEVQALKVKERETNAGKLVTACTILQYAGLLFKLEFSAYTKTKFMLDTIKRYMKVTGVAFPNN